MLVSRRETNAHHPTRQGVRDGEVRKFQDSIRHQLRQRELDEVSDAPVQVSQGPQGLQRQLPEAAAYPHAEPVQLGSLQHHRARFGGLTCLEQPARKGRLLSPEWNISTKSVVVS
jgi:hypothetical protein